MNSPNKKFIEMNKTFVIDNKTNSNDFFRIESAAQVPESAFRRHRNVR